MLDNQFDDSVCPTGKPGGSVWAWHLLLAAAAGAGAARLAHGRALPQRAMVFYRAGLLQARITLRLNPASPRGILR